MPEPLEFSTESHAEGVIVRCSGRLVAGNTDSLRQQVRPLLEPERRVVLDLSGLTQMDSTGLGTIVSLYVSAKSAGGRLELINLGQKIRLLFSMTNLLSVFEPVGGSNFRLP